eukprot:CAMPEP_0170505238 /NCGR_PEP_ID=MMETSP0208-20121228/50284_1 /TAXON_ID=197538 /ORGANISM="Strombidium inclinatum, Strain S3" /LENGTH=93 /DNA_ID=CAMNT_0010785979 /DNA_START=136 /DNA_END=413 /DNA_ORIENTATION=+
MLIQDQNDDIFGCFMVEEWHHSGNQFYGSGLGSFLFKIHCKSQGTKRVADSISVFEPLFFNNRYQHSNTKSLTVGASTSGNSSLFVTDNFRDG